MSSMALMVCLLAAAGQPPRVHDGSSVVSLDGTWEARLSDEGGLEDVGTWQPIRVPGNFPFQGVKYDGVAWLRVGFTLPDTSADFAVRIPMAANAYELFLNGTRVGGRGRISPSGDLLEKDLRGQVYRLPRESLRAGATNVLLLRLRTFYGNGGVMAPGVLLGPELAVRDAHERIIAKVSGLVALFFFAAFFHLVLFVGRTRDRHYLSFALLSSALASITAGINTLGYLLTSNVDFNSYLVFVPLLVMPFCLVLFFSDFFSRQARWLKRGTLVLAGFGTLTLLASTAYNPIFPFFEGVVLPVAALALVGALCLSTGWTVQAMRGGQLGASVILFGLGVYALTGVLELAWTFDLIGFRVDSYLGFAFFIGAMVVAIASRFAWLHRQVEIGERDVLTGCLTRHGFLERLAAALSGHEQPTCIMLDLDHFKQVNDTHGHQTGDKVLVATGNAVRKVLRGSDLVARWGGEEFLVLLPERDTTAARDVARRMQEALKLERVEGLAITASFGIATRGAGESLDAWFARADRALYEAKDAGRDCIRLAA